MGVMPETSTSAGRSRIAALDVIRGFALCGVVIANVQPIASFGTGVARTSVPTDHAWLGLLVYHRFYPIFSVLFGVGFSLLLDSATGRAGRPRLLLLRRLLVLLAAGLAHYLLLWQGDVLTVYALAGLVVLLPSSWLPRRVVAGLAAVLVVVGLLFGGGSYAMAPGLFLLGSALVRYGVIERIERSTLAPAGLGLILLAAAMPFLWVPALQDVRAALPAAGLLTAGGYVCALLVVLRTPVRHVFRTVFEPLGRMALTNYLTATVLVLTVARYVDGPPERWPSATILLIAGAVLALQWVWSTLWLRRFRQGPLEYLWRWATWAHRPPLRRSHSRIRSQDDGQGRRRDTAATRRTADATAART